MKLFAKSNRTIVFATTFRWFVKWFFCFSFFFSANAQNNRTVEYFEIGEENEEEGNAVMIGMISGEESGEGLNGATIRVWGENKGAVSDSKGRYLLLLPKGEYQLTITYVGKVSKQIKVKLIGDGQLNISLKDRVVNLESVIINSEASDQNTRGVAAGVTKLDIIEIEKVPAFLGEVDVIKSLQLMPGVTTVGEGAAGFNVRGGRSDQNLVLQNGSILFNTSHVLGFFSVFNPDVTERFTLYKGHIPAQYGGRISSVLSVDLKEASSESIKVKGGLGVVASRLTLETPLFSQNTSVIVGFRSSYSDWILGQTKDLDLRQSAADFFDLNVNLTHRKGEKNKLTLGYYQSSDFFRFSDQFGFDWGNKLLNFHWNSSISPSLHSNLILAFGNYRNSTFEPSGPDAIQVSNGMDYFQLKEDIEIIKWSNYQIHTGLELNIYNTKPEISNPYNQESGITPNRIEKENGRELSAYIDNEWEISPKFSLSTGLRVTYFQSLGPSLSYNYIDPEFPQEGAIIDSIQHPRGDEIASYFGLSPRIAGRFLINETSSFKVNYNRMNQFIHSMSNTASPTPVDIWQMSNQYIQPMHADNFGLGYFKNFRDNIWETSLEVYYKKIYNLNDYRDFASLLLNPHIETELLRGQGYGYGLELLMKKNSGKWSGWLSYAYSRTFVRIKGNNDQNINNGAYYPANFDKPHNLTLVSKLMIGRKSSFNAVFTYNTGRPITAINTTYDVNNVAVPLFSDRNQYRIPDYLRLDISLTVADNIWKHRVGRDLDKRRYKDSLTFSIYNLLGRRNAFSVYYALPDEFYLTPQPHRLSVLGSVFPSVTYNFEF